VKTSDKRVNVKRPGKHVRGQAAEKKKVCLVINFHGLFASLTKYQKMVVITNDDDVNSDSERSDNTPANKGVELRDLPEWAKSGWSTRFLRTLYHAINASTAPLSEFKTDGTDTIKTINRILKNAYPAMNYRVTKSDSLFLMVRAKKSHNSGLISFNRRSSGPMSTSQRSFE
jgi:hypothetical protein